MKDYINSIRFLGVDAVNNANSGHPGICLGAAPIISELYVNHVKCAPKEPKWINRDYFIMSCGHGSPLFYSTLYHIGFDISMDDMKQFRQLGSITPGHPESTLTPGVDATTGPLGQGFAQAVGVATAEKMLARDFNEKEFPLIDHYTYVLCSDGDVQEGIFAEALSLAGNLRLNKLIALLDSNDIQLDGPVSLASVDNFKMRVESCGWDYILVKDGNDTQEVAKAITKAKTTDKPTFIEVKTILGEGTTHAGTAITHGSPIGDDERTKAAKHFGHDQKPFEIKDSVQKFIIDTKAAKDANYDQWLKLLEDYKIKFPKKYKLFNEAINRTYKIDLISEFKDFVAKDEATRVSGGRFLKYLSENTRLLVGGSGDVKKSTGVLFHGKDYPEGNNISYGVREFAMNSLCNGIALHRGFIPFGGTYLPFSDYLKPALRIAAIQKLPIILFFTHDSIAVGEDGETHQPIEQITSLRSIPHVNVMRPADFKETLFAFQIAFNEEKRPSVLLLTRQGVPQFSKATFEEFKKGAYIVKKESSDRPILTIVATGSEVHLVYQAVQLLDKKDMVRIVSMPSTQLFDETSKEEQLKIIPNHSKTLFVETSDGIYGYKYAKYVYAIEDSFGTCGKGPDVFKHFKFTAKDIKERIEKLL